MAFQDLATVAVLSRLADGWNLIRADEPQCPDMGWDVLPCVFIRDFEAEVVTALDVVADWPIGKRPIAGKDFWTVSRQPKRLAGNIWQLDVTAHGTAGGRPLKHQITASTSVRTVDYTGLLLNNYTYPIQKAYVKDSSPVLTVSYVLVGEDPPTTKLGEPGLTPPVNVAVRAATWTQLNKFNVNIPDGWHLDNLEADVLAGTDLPVSLITATWLHQYKMLPAD